METTQQVVESLSLFEAAAKFMAEGGIHTWIILSVWSVGAAISVNRFLRLRKYQIDAPSFMNDIKKHVFNNDVQGAIQYCTGSASLLAVVIKAGLKRVNQTRQQIQDIVEATILECQGHADKGLNWVALISSVSTLFGLLGTIHGLIITFGNVTVMDPAEKARLLSVGISTAMNATAMGLVSAISLMFVHMYLANKAQKIAADLDEQAMRLVDLLGNRKGIAEDKDAA